MNQGRAAAMAQTHDDTAGESHGYHPPCRPDRRPYTAALFGLITGVIFGIAAQRSGFCLRASVVEFAKGRLGNRMAIWLLAFSTALVWVQMADLSGLMRSADARMMAVPGSVSGAIVGGLMFGAGMVLARGCSGRLLVLAATGNLRSIVSGLVFAVVAQMALQGWLAPLRNWIAALWITPGGSNIDLLSALHLPREAGLSPALSSPSSRCGWRGATGSACGCWSWPRASALPSRSAGC